MASVQLQNEIIRVCDTQLEIIFYNLLAHGPADGGIICSALNIMLLCFPSHLENWWTLESVSGIKGL